MSKDFEFYRNQDPATALAAIIEGEAGGEGPAGMTAVGNTIDNRAKQNFRGLGATPVEQAYAPNQFQAVRPPGAVARRVAENLLRGTLADTTGGATFYANPRTSDPGNWGSRLDPSNAYQIGRHFFTNNQEGQPFSGPGHDNSAIADEREASASSTPRSDGFGSEMGKNIGLRADSPQDRATINKYLAEGGVLDNNGQPFDAGKMAWCAAWVNAQLAREGVPGSESVEGSRGHAWAADFLKWGTAESGDKAQAGDVMVKNDGAHVGRYTGKSRIANGQKQYQMYAGNDREQNEAAPNAGRQQWGGVETTWESPSNYSFRRPLSSTAAQVARRTLPGDPTERQERRNAAVAAISHPGVDARNSPSGQRHHLAHLRELHEHVAVLHQKIADLEARVERVHRKGRVTDVNTKNQTFRMEIAASCDSQTSTKSPWLPYAQTSGGAEGLNIHSPPVVGQQFLCINPDGSQDFTQSLGLSHGWYQSNPSPSTDPSSDVVVRGTTVAVRSMNSLALSIGGTLSGALKSTITGGITRLITAAGHFITAPNAAVSVTAKTTTHTSQTSHVDTVTDGSLTHVSQNGNIVNNAGSAQNPGSIINTATMGTITNTASMMSFSADVINIA